MLRKISTALPIRQGGLWDVYTTIGDYAFSRCTNLASIDLPNSVTTIGGGAFRDCTGLASIEIPNFVATIGSFAFESCTGLTSIKIPNSVTTIQEGVFKYCTGLTSIEIPNSVVTINWSAFCGCSGLTSVEIPNSVTTVGGYAFYQCTGLTAIKISNSVTTIQESVFSKCTGLTSIDIPNSVTTIGSYAFESCSGLTSIKIPNSVIEIGVETFSGCLSLNELIIPQSIRKIGRRAFSQVPLRKITCYALESPDLYDDEVFDADVRNTGALYVALESLDDYKKNWSCFRYILVHDFEELIYSLSSPGTLLDLVNPDDVDNIRALKLIGRINGTDLLTINKMTNLQKIDLSEASIVSGGLPYYEDDNKKFEAESDILGVYWAYNLDKLVEVIMPKNINTIECNALSGKIVLETVKIPDSVTEIGSSVFEDCIGLVELSIPASVTTLGASVFKGCRVLTNISIPESITAIGSYVFDGCVSLKEVVIPPSVVSLGLGAFRNCTRLASLEIPRSLVTIGDAAFEGCTSLTELTVPNTVNTIGAGAFNICRNLNNLIIEDGEYELKFESLDGSTVGSFNNCPLRTTYLGRNVLHLNVDQPFRANGALTYLTLGRFVNTISASAFEYCTGLREVEILGSLTSIEPSTFRYCMALEKITIPYPVAEIGISAFSSCNSLESIVLPGTIRKIDQFAFFGCNRLKSVSVVNPIPAEIKDVSFPTSMRNITLVVPKGSEEIYSAHRYWGAFSNIEARDVVDEFDFVVDEVMYHITSENDRTVEVSAFKNGRSSANCMAVPQTVVFNSQTYTVIGIANNGVENCGVSSVRLPAITAYVGLRAFSGNSSLKTIICDAIVPPVVDHNSFDEDIYSKAELLVPLDSEEAYRNDEVWGLFNIRSVDQNILVRELSVDPLEWIGEVGEELSITAIVLPSDATCKTLQWSTSDPNVAKVSDDGVVTVVGSGECVVTVATVDGSGLTATCRVKTGTTGIESIFECGENIRVYTPAGVCIYEGVSDKMNLSPGIYLIMTDTRVERVVIK
ncbi:MAG: leucine-rich repeat protein [Muribaculaceae bacterium]|nr:leucine-rich repeat protein [Muribaculaceae bacterium]